MAGTTTNGVDALKLIGQIIQLRSRKISEALITIQIIIAVVSENSIVIAATKNMIIPIATSQNIISMIFGIHIFHKIDVNKAIAEDGIITTISFNLVVIAKAINFIISVLTDAWQTPVKIAVAINIITQIAAIYPVVATSSKKTVSFISGVIRLLINTGYTPVPGRCLINAPCPSGKYLLYTIIWHLPALIREQTLRRIQTIIGENEIISRTAIQQILAARARNQIMAFTTINIIIALAAAQGIIPTKTINFQLVYFGSHTVNDIIKILLDNAMWRINGTIRITFIPVVPVILTVVFPLHIVRDIFLTHNSGTPITQ